VTELAAVELQKKIAEGEMRLKQQQALYEAVRADRNLYRWGGAGGGAEAGTGRGWGARPQAWRLALSPSGPGRERCCRLQLPGPPAKGAPAGLYCRKWPLVLVLIAVKG
jgi:hypothetical protein